ncbi:MAG: hypothetical protein QOI70_94 [Microbacteriaceae bacterium]|jgi:hypothetical protein|nr:hypothetical protein [Microbacteriaceae bacterium]
MLREKRRYGELDLIRAVILDEVNRRLKPKATKSVWPQVETEIDHPGQRLEVVVALSTLDASVARSHSELDVVLPRDEATMVIDLEPRVRRARERLARFRARLGNNEHAHLSSAREQEARTVIEPSAGQS